MPHHVETLSSGSWGVSLDVRLVFHGNKQLIRVVRESVERVCTSLLSNHDAMRLPIVAQELLENLVKYSTAEPGSFGFELRERSGEPFVVFQTENTATLEHLQRAANRLERIGNSPDPVALYETWIAESSEWTGSDLGLARICAEARMDLSYRIQGNRITLVASSGAQHRATAELVPS